MGLPRERQLVTEEVGKEDQTLGETELEKQSVLLGLVLVRAV